MADEDLVLVERDATGYAVVTLNRAGAMNALSRELMTALAGAIRALAADAGVRVLVLTGAGRAFCAGLDLKQIGRGEGVLGSPEAAAELGDRAGWDPVAALEAFPGPVVGAINGAAVTGGFELALACDVLVASPAARFADTHARLGIAPAWGLSQKLSRIVGLHRAREASFTGNWIGAEQALAWGLVNRVVAADELLPAARRLALDMLGAVPGMLERYKSLIDDGYALPYGEAREMERRRSRGANAAVSAGAIESRREAVRQRNRGG